ncbi:MAG: dephospho-CoA kinase [Candidatus Omnitrophica bacterium]|nr:dephospho-CoA kinase [Candidatus Omnitrophota bacterium]
MAKKIIIGVTGTFSSGKTSVAEMILAMGASRKVDADKIGHKLLAERSVIRRVTDVFGNGVLSGERIDRKKLGKIVFSDKKKLGFLNDIMHPLILGRIKEEVDSVPRGAVVIDAPLLIETKLDKLADIVVVVLTDDDIAAKRAILKGFTKKEIDGVRSHQLTLPEKLKAADFIIDNNGGIDKTKEGVNELWKKVQKSLKA